MTTNETHLPVLSQEAGSTAPIATITMLMANMNEPHVKTTFARALQGIQGPAGLDGANGKDAMTTEDRTLLDNLKLIAQAQGYSFAPPVLDIVLNGEAERGCPYALSQTGSTADTWHWTFSDGQTAEYLNPSVTFEDVGTHTVTLTASNVFGSTTITKTIEVVEFVDGPEVMLGEADFERFAFADHRYDFNQSSMRWTGDVAINPAVGEGQYELDDNHADYPAIYFGLTRQFVLTRVEITSQSQTEAFQVAFAYDKDSNFSNGALTLGDGSEWNTVDFTEGTICEIAIEASDNQPVRGERGFVLWFYPYNPKVAFSKIRLYGKPRVKADEGNSRPQNAVNP